MILFGVGDTMGRFRAPPNIQSLGRRALHTRIQLLEPAAFHAWGKKLYQISTLLGTISTTIVSVLNIHYTL